MTEARAETLPAAPPTAGVKSIYLARAHPALARDRFVPRWRQHGALAMRLPFWRHAGRYTHGDVIVAPPALCGALALDDERFYGVGMVWFPGGQQALRELVEDPTYPQLYEDEPEAFGDYVDDVTLLTQETVVRAAREGRPVGARLIVFVALPADRDVDAWWAQQRVALERDAQELQTLAVNRAIWPEGTGGRPLPHSRTRSALEGFVAVVDLGFADHVALAAYCERHAIAGATPLGAERAIVLVTNEVVLDVDAR